jgi:hypothetical protein
MRTIVSPLHHATNRQNRARVVALYSQSYLDSKYCVREATEALKGDPANERQRLIPLRIEPCAPAGMLDVTYTDLIAERRQADATGQCQT